MVSLLRVIPVLFGDDHTVTKSPRLCDYCGFQENPPEIELCRGWCTVCKSSYDLYFCCDNCEVNGYEEHSAFCPAVQGNEYLDLDSDDTGSFAQLWSQQVMEAEERIKARKLSKGAQNPSITQPEEAANPINAHETIDTENQVEPEETPKRKKRKRGIGTPTSSPLNRPLKRKTINE